MNLFASIKLLVLDKLTQMQSDGFLPKDIDLSNITVEPPRDPLHGDMATNAAMVLAKAAKMPPRDIAAALAQKLCDDARVLSADVAGPGFLNLRLDPKIWLSIIPNALNQGTGFGRSTMGAGQRVNVEFVSANPTGPLHVGHTRGAVFGDALAALLDFVGFDVTREYYINDGGAQVDVLARSIYLRYLEACGQTVEFPDGTYPGDYLIPVGKAVKKRFGQSLVGQDESKWLVQLRDMATDAMMALIRDDLASIGVKMDRFFSEKSLYGSGLIEEALSVLDAKGLLYEGVLEPPKGKAPVDWEPREQTLFRSSAHGDDVDRPVKKSDGSWTYFAPDIAYHYDKIQRGYDRLIDVLGADHGGYVKRMRAAVSALSDGKVPLDVRLTQLVRLYQGGEPFKMSKRTGNFILLSDVVELVGKDVVRFVMLTRKNDAPLDFDFEKALEQSKDNPVFYVQYAHARVCSVMEKARGLGFDVTRETLAQADLSSLKDPGELALARKLAEWPRLLELAAKHNEPHRVAFYLYELSGVFHALWNRGKEHPELRFLQEDQDNVTLAKLALIDAVKVAVSTGLGILGVIPMQEMR